MATREGGVGEAVYSGVKWLGLAMAANQLARLITTAVLAHLLLKEDFGIVTLAVTATQALSTFREIGFGQALIQRQTDGREEGRVVADTAFWIVQVTNILVFVPGWVLAPRIASFFGEAYAEDVPGVLRALLVAFLLGGFSTVSGAMLQRDLRFQALSRNEMRATLVYAAVAIGTALAGLGYWSMVCGQLSSQAVQTSGLLRLSGWRPSLRFDLRIARELFRFGKWLWLSTILQLIHRSADKVFLGYHHGPGTLGAFGIASNLCTAPARPVANILVRILFPSLSRMQGDRQLIARAYTRGLAFACFIALPGVVGLILVARDFVPTVYGAKWAEMPPLVQILALYGGAVFTGGLARPVLLALGRPGIMTAISTVRQALILVLLILLAPDGARGVAWAVTAPTLGSLVASHLAAMAACGGSHSSFHRHLVPCAVVVTVMAGAVFGLQQLIGDTLSSLPRLVVAVITGIVVYAAASRLIHPQGLMMVREHARRLLRARGDDS